MSNTNYYQSSGSVKPGDIYYYGVQVGRSGVTYTEFLVEVLSTKEEYCEVEPVSGDGCFTVEYDQLYSKDKS